MIRSRFLLVLVCCTLAAGSLALAQGRGGRGAAAAPLDISGRWSGVWSSYHPAQGATPPQELCAKLDATVSRRDDTWLATFEGDCGRPYTYTIAMEGRQVGPVVLFSGTADLGARDGGVYDWIGRANAEEFIGFYTSAFATGTFTMARVPAN
jgi:hypothetical protein